MWGMTNPRCIPRLAAVFHTAKFETGKVEIVHLVEIIPDHSPFVFDADVGARSPTSRRAVMKPKTLLSPPTCAPFTRAQPHNTIKHLEGMLAAVATVIGDR